jgi:hypothetical protein
MKFIGVDATEKAFVNEVGKPLAAVGFIGHSLLTGNIHAITPECITYSVGLKLYDENLAADPSNATPDCPVENYANSVPVQKLQTQAHIIFIAACDIGPVFKNLWNIHDTVNGQGGTKGQALVVPVGEENTVTLGHAVTYWDRLLFDLVVKHMQLGPAVDESNAYFLTLGNDVNGKPITEQWKVIGDGDVTIN